MKTLARFKCGFGGAACAAIASLVLLAGGDSGRADKPAPESVGDAGAFDIEKRKEEHWAWSPIRAVQTPAVRDSTWPRDPLDAFILAKLEQASLAPAPTADRPTLIRRLYLDLVGLPPTPDEIQEFLGNSSSGAYEQLVDLLLASAHFGERWGRHWLDHVRFAETYGHEFDYEIPEAWRYRDYVIRALNADVPYDQFVIEHIAGDLTPRPRRHPTEGYNESIIGTGFWWLSQGTHSPVDVRQDEAERVDNQIDVFSKTFLGLTVACARCHDHKFDAISTEDFYALAVDQPTAALLTDLKQRGLLDETVVLWGGEFGRTPFAQGTDGRDHNPFGFSVWIAGGGIRPGMTYGQTDEFGYHAVENRVEMYDLHATILHLLGIDHRQLTVRFGGRDMRLTDVHGHVIHDILA